MKNSKKEIVLNCEKLERRFVLLNNKRIEEYQIEHNDNTPKVGDIYLGRIVNLDTSLQAAFVDIGAKKNAFLHFKEMLPGNSELLEKYQLEQKEEKITVKHRKKKSTAENKEIAEERSRRTRVTAENIPEIFKPGMQILVQVVKSPISTKGAKITTDITIPGRYLVLMPYHDQIALSTRISGNTERSRLRKILSELELPENMGAICRTAGEGRRAGFFKRDLELLLASWEDIAKKVAQQKAPRLLLTEPTLIERTIRDFATEEINSIIVDDAEACTQIKETLKKIGCGKMTSSVTLHKSAIPIFDYYNINEQLDNVFKREVKLPGGGAIVIDETEALIAIDVNSGHGRKNADQPEFILQTNMEAAEEIARQLRLRNVGGLVVIDFIDMRSAGDREKLFRQMKTLVKDDKAKTQLCPLSKLGLMEMTRQREHESIQDQIYSPCPYCHGSGLVKSALSVSVDIQRALNAVMKDKRNRKMTIRVIMHPDILTRLHTEDASILRELETKYQYDLSFRSDPELHLEEFRLVDPLTGEELKH